jgi:hypothetical protein
LVVGSVGRRECLLKKEWLMMDEGDIQYIEEGILFRDTETEDKRIRILNYIYKKYKNIFLEAYSKTE